jgi:hypothetical protein
MMQGTAKRNGVTFAVDEVAPATTALSETRMHEALASVIGPMESCSNYHATVALAPGCQPLLAAVYKAFSEHRPLSISPDAVWLTIAQGVAHHMLVHGERLRSRFVAHSGRLKLSFATRGWTAGSPENPWHEAFAFWAAKIREHVGAVLHDALVCDFSTSGPVEQTASRIVMMDIFERYFHYDLVGICGIPEITLEGVPADWERLSEKVEGLAPFEFDWWLEHLRPICGQFVRASQGDVDLSHWREVCKLRQAYGGDVVNGWVAKLFPYLRQFDNGPCTRRNPIFESGEGFQTRMGPLGFSRVPFTWTNEDGGERLMEAVGGLVGVAQDPESRALRPIAGWAVREVSKQDAIAAKVAREHRTFPGRRVEVSDDEWRTAMIRAISLPRDVLAFYHQTDGAELFAGTENAVRIRGEEEIERLDWGSPSEADAINDLYEGHKWHRLADFPDGGMIAVNPHPEWPEQVRKGERWKPDNFAAYCHCRPETAGVPDQNPVVALSFTELLERLLAENGRRYWLDPDFVGYGDAEEYTRRD